VLDRIEQGFDWLAFEALLSPIHGSAMGAPGYPPLTMFKILLVQQWRTLSDRGAEEAVRDRLSFPRFCGLPLDVETPRPRLDLAVSPDDRQAWLVHEALGRSQPAYRRARLVIKRGTLVDAALIAGAVRVLDVRGGFNPRNPEARFTRKRDKTYFGTKAYLAVDEESGLASGRDDPGQCARRPFGRSADLG
jgi:transposase, IS5 family